MRFEVVAWDWKGRPSSEWLNEALTKFGEPIVVDVDTGGDNYAIIVHDRRDTMTEEIAQTAYEIWYLEIAARDTEAQGHREAAEKMREEAADLRGSCEYIYTIS